MLLLWILFSGIVTLGATLTRSPSLGASKCRVNMKLIFCTVYRILHSGESTADRKVPGSTLGVPWLNQAGFDFLGPFLGIEHFEVIYISSQ